MIILTDAEISPLIIITLLFYGLAALLTFLWIKSLK